MNFEEYVVNISKQNAFLISKQYSSNPCLVKYEKRVLLLDDLAFAMSVCRLLPKSYVFSNIIVTSVLN